MEELIDEQSSNLPIKPRNPWIAFFCSLLVPGLGQVYNGQPRKAAAFFVAVILFPVVAGLIGGMSSFYGLVLLFVGILALRGFILLDSVANALRQKDYVLKPYNTWYYYLLMGLAFFAIFWFYNPKSLMGFQSFQLPTTANSPTLEVGDYLMADMKAYKSSEPNYGDIVVFKKEDGLQYLYRVVGRPGDHLEIVDNIVKINGILSKTRFIRDTVSEQMPVTEMEEELPNGHQHRIYQFKQQNEFMRKNVQNITVPEKYYYLLGDHRDNAFDSRFDGAVNRSNIQGRLLYSYWGTAVDRIGINFTDR